MAKAPSKKQVTRRQHWLPRTSYLRNFVKDDGKLSAYIFKENDKVGFHSSAKHLHVTPENIGLKNDLYETPALPVNAIEDILAKIESAYGKVFSGKIRNEQRLTEGEHNIVARYVSTLENRSVAQKAHIEGFADKLEERGRALAIAHGSQEAAEDWSQEIAELKKVMFAQYMEVTLDVNKWSALDFCFLKPASFVEERFITSDNPVTLVDFASDNQFVGLNHWNDTAECVVVLSPDIALFGNTRGITGYREVDYNMLREINHRVLRRSDKMVISQLDIEKSAVGAFLRRNPQSLLLYFIQFHRKSRKAKILEKVEKLEREGRRG